VSIFVLSIVMSIDYSVPLLAAVRS
jgi:hypothetical protein